MDTTSHEKYPAFPKIPRLYKPISITEKIDGTNGLVKINHPDRYGTGPVIEVGSRNRWLSYTDDNFGFYKFVMERAGEFIDLLGPGFHYGEFWGKGIQRGYGLDYRKFSLFNVHRWAQKPLPKEVDIVPVLYTGDFSEAMILDVQRDLQTHGSYAATGFMQPEGVMIYHEAGNQYFKVPFDKA